MDPLRKCPSCGRDVSQRAASCPGCGEPFRLAAATNGGFNLRDPVHVLGLIAVCLVFIICLMYGIIQARMNIQRERSLAEIEEINLKYGQ